MFRAPCAVALALGLAACSREPGPRRQDPNVPNPPSIGVIDVPAANQRVGPAIMVGGWALDESGVTRVRIWADNRLLTSVPLTVARPDVEKVFPKFVMPGAIHGWQAVVDFGEYVGYCVIHADALDGRGAMTRFADVTVRIAP
jgi:hypothetical protein